MNFKELLKKYWFVGVVALVLVVFIGAYGVDAYKNREVTVSSKTVDGKSVAYSVNDEFGYADDLYETLYSTNGLMMSFNAYQRAVLGKAYETTDEMSNIASQYAQYAIYQYGESAIQNDLYAMGYVNGVDDLAQYYIDAQKQEKLIADYLKAHEAELVTPYINENNPRVIYQIVIKIADIEEIENEDGTKTHIAHPSEDEQAKVDEMLEALKTKTFEEVAVQYSEDGTAQNGGYLGVLDNTNVNNYAKEFGDVAMKLNSGEQSDLVTSEFGYHIILNKSNEVEYLLNDSSFISLLQNVDNSFGIKAVVDKADEFGFEIVDQKLLDEINSVIGGNE